MIIYIFSVLAFTTIVMLLMKKNKQRGNDTDKPPRHPKFHRQESYDLQAEHGLYGPNGIIHRTLSGGPTNPSHSLFSEPAKLNVYKLDRAQSLPETRESHEVVDSTSSTSSSTSTSTSTSHSVGSMSSMDSQTTKKKRTPVYFTWDTNSKLSHSNSSHVVSIPCAQIQ
jgi:hypothetical protein